MKHFEVTIQIINLLLKHLVHYYLRIANLWQIVGYLEILDKFVFACSDGTEDNSVVHALLYCTQLPMVLVQLLAIVGTLYVHLTPCQLLL